MLKIILVVTLIYGPTDIERHEFVSYDDNLNACWAEAERTIIEDDVDDAYCIVESVDL